MEALYPMAAGVSAQTDKELTTFIGRAHRDHLEEFFSVFRDRLQRPRFSEEDFERNKTQLLNFLEKSLRSSDDEELGKHAYESVLFAGHPYRHPVQGTVRGVNAITLEDVERFYREHYSFANLQLGLAGDIPDGFAERAREDFRRRAPRGRELQARPAGVGVGEGAPGPGRRPATGRGDRDQPRVSARRHPRGR